MSSRDLSMSSRDLSMSSRDLSMSSRDLSMSSRTNDLKIGIPVAALKGAWRYRVSAGWSGVSIL